MIGTFNNLAKNLPGLFFMGSLSRRHIRILKILQLHGPLLIDSLVERVVTATIDEKSKDGSGVMSRKRIKAMRRIIRNDLSSGRGLIAQGLVERVHGSSQQLLLTSLGDEAVMSADTTQTQRSFGPGAAAGATLRLIFSAPRSLWESSSRHMKHLYPKDLSALTSRLSRARLRSSSEKMGQRGLAIDPAVNSVNSVDSSAVSMTAAAAKPLLALVEDLPYVPAMPLNTTPVNQPSKVEAEPSAQYPAELNEADSTALDLKVKRGRSVLWTWLLSSLAVMAGTVALFGYWEMRTGTIQSYWLHSASAQMTFLVLPGASADIRFAKDGPHDLRLGYGRIPDFMEKLLHAGYSVTSQARLSNEHRDAIDRGVFPIYQEKTVAGLRILDKSGKSFYDEHFPRRYYSSFDQVPPAVIQTLLFIENRELLDQRFPRRNPAIEWERLSKASFDLLLSRVLHDRSAPGGSTLATQMEKFRHSYEGRTSQTRDKLRQMASATLRSYHDSTDTMAARKTILLDYVNSVPLGAVSYSGEVNGLAEGLSAWYGQDFDEANWLLRQVEIKEMKSHDGFLDLLDRKAVQLGELLFGTAAELAGYREKTVQKPAALASQEIATTNASTSTSTSASTDNVSQDAEGLKASAKVYREVLSLFLSQRRPLLYLQNDPQALEQLTDDYLSLLADSGIITPALRDVALLEKPRLSSKGQLKRTKLSFLDRKAANSVRIEMGRLLGEKKLYNLDRLDLDVRSTFDAPTQKAVSQLLKDAKDPDKAEQFGMTGFHLLEKERAGDVIYSFTLLEHKGNQNIIRVQTDSIDGPLNFNEGGKLELGSTAKLRTLVSYLDIITEMWTKYAPLPEADITAARDQAASAGDPLALWLTDYLLITRNDKSLAATLAASMQRRYSGSPSQAFVTGGGLMRFSNFDDKEDRQVYPLTEGFRHSVNLVFIRLMRDIIAHLTVVKIPDAHAILSNPTDSRRLDYLKRFAERDSQEYAVRFYARHRSESYEQALQGLVSNKGMTPRRLAAILRSVDPQQDFRGFLQQMRQNYDESRVGDGEAQRLYLSLSPTAMSLRDRGYTAKVHPLKLWMIGFLRQQPNASIVKVLEASRQDRLDMYGWLYQSKNHERQNKNIRNIFEQDAFLALHGYWKKVGFPFGALTPTLATALGSSGDRPAALAELMGIIVNDGVRYPSARIEGLRFASSTPFETELRLDSPAAPETILAPEITAVVKEALLDVVENGTAVRVKGAFRRQDGTLIPVGGKTGTGDNRYEVFGTGGKLLSSKAVSRTATLVFYIGDRFFGTMTAFVPEGKAENFSFTSGLSAQLLKTLAPTLLPFLEKEGVQGIISLPEAPVTTEQK